MLTSAHTGLSVSVLSSRRREERPGQPDQEGGERFFLYRSVVCVTVREKMEKDPELLFTRQEKIGKGNFGEVYKG